MDKKSVGFEIAQRQLQPLVVLGAGEAAEPIFLNPIQALDILEDSMIAKVVEIFFSFIGNQFGTPHSKSFSLDALVEIMACRLRELLSSFVYSFSGIILASAGFLMTYFNLLSQYDLAETINLNAVSIGGIVLVFVGLALLAVGLYSKRTSAVPSDVLVPAVNPIEVALSTLILDFVKERETNRELKPSAKADRSQAYDMGPPLRPLAANAAVFTDGTGVLS